MTRTNLVLVAPFALLIAGCVPLDDGLGSGFGTDLSGSVQGVGFAFASGGADSVDDGYVITLADTPEFACDSFDAPPLTYISISISGVDDAPTSYDAAGSVFFNSFQEGVSASEAASSGTVTIDEIDLSFGGRITGSVDASSPESDIFGSFDVDICS